MPLSSFEDDDKVIDQKQMIKELRERIRLLQLDRRVSIEQLEVSKTSNAEEIKILQNENKDLKLRYNQLKKSLQEEIHGESLVEHLQKETRSIRSEYNSLKLKSKKLAKELNDLHDEEKALQLDVMTNNDDDNCQNSQKIRTLENRIENVTIKHKEAESIRDTYDQIVKRLKKERISFDNQLNALEHALYSKSQDCDQLLILSNDALHARDNTLQELQKATVDYEEKKKMRNAELREYHQVVKVRNKILLRQEESDHKLNEIRLNREQQHQKQLAQKFENDEKNNAFVAGDDVEKYLNVEESRQDSPESIVSTSAGNVNNHYSLKLKDLEASFQKIVEVTGTSDINAIIQKIVDQKSTKDNISKQIKQDKIKIEELTQCREELKKQVEEIKYGISKNIAETTVMTDNKNYVEEKEVQLKEITFDLEKDKRANDRISTTLINVMSGVNHIAETIKNNPVVRSNKEEILFGGPNKKIIVNENTVVDVFLSSEKILSEIFEEVSDFDLSSCTITTTDQKSFYNYIDRPITPASSSMDDSMLKPQTYYEYNLKKNLRSNLQLSPSTAGGGRLQLRPASNNSMLLHNKSTTLKKYLDNDDEGNHNNNDLDEFEAEGEEISRDQLKKKSSQIVKTEEKKRRREKRLEELRLIEENN